VTVVLAIRCSDGIVVAADTQVTDSDRGMSYPARKLHPLGEGGAWGGSGSRAVLTDLERDFGANAATILEAEDVPRALQQRVLPVLRHHYDHFIADVPGEDGSGSGPSAYVLAAGYSGDDPWIVEVNPNAMVSRYEDVGFHAIGSGAPMAQQAGALLAHFRMAERPVRYGEVVAVRVLEALGMTSPSVGHEFDLCRITPEGAEPLSEEEVAEARELVRSWAEREHDVVDALLAGE
jgi:proteasome beta subunit